MFATISIHTTLGQLEFEYPKLYYLGQLLSSINCPNCDSILEGQIVVNRKNKKYKYKLYCSTCSNHF